jgi:hypothetical protein
MTKYKKNDIVLVKSRAGSAIPDIHVKLLKRVVVKERKSRDPKYPWPAYSGWEATPVYQHEINLLKKQWSIPFTEPEKDLTFVYDEDIIKKESKNEHIRNRRKKQ